MLNLILYFRALAAEAFDFYRYKLLKYTTLYKNPISAYNSVTLTKTVDTSVLISTKYG